MRVLGVLFAVVFLAVVATAQAPAGRGGQAPAVRAARAPSVQPVGTLLQVMRGILFPNSNIIFAVQKELPTVKPQDVTPTDEYRGVYTGWVVVENAAVAIAEAADLLTKPGRVCSNGKPVPVTRPDWVKNVQTLRMAAAATLEAAKTRKQDAVIDAVNGLTDACEVCHEVYRDKAAVGTPGRCTP